MKHKKIILIIVIIAVVLALLHLGASALLPALQSIHGGGMY